VETWLPNTVLDLSEYVQPQSQQRNQNCKEKFLTAYQEVLQTLRMKRRSLE